MASLMIGEVRITYGVDSELYSSHTQHFELDNYNEDMLGAPVVPIGDPGAGGSTHSIHEYIQGYCGCLNEVAQAGIQVLTANLSVFTWDSFTGEEVRIGGRSYTVTGFAPPIANIGDRGPRGSKFFHGKQPIFLTGKNGGVFWGFISGKFAGFPKQFAPGDISTSFLNNYSALTALSAPILNYKARTKALHTYTDYVNKGVPSALVYFGIRNG